MVRLFVVYFGLMMLMPSCYANLPVFDVGNLLESINQTKTQVEMYKTHLQQYQSMMKAAQSLKTFHWDDASTTINQLISTVDTLNRYQQEAGSLDAYLARYRTSNDYRRLPCLNGASCTTAELQALRESERQASQAQKRTNDAMLRGLDEQQRALARDASQLRLLQTQAQDAPGQMAALQAANQLASTQTHQLLHIRGLLVAQHNAAVTRAAALADREALQAAADERFRAGQFEKSPPKAW